MSTPVLLPADADPVLGPMLNQFVACVCAELAAAGRPVCACCLVWGNSPPPADFCACDCEGGGSGQAWVRVMRWSPAQTTNIVAQRKCQAWRYQVWLEAGVYRCVATSEPGSDGEAPPTCAQRNDDAWGLLADARHLRKAASCCAAFDGKLVTLVTEEPMSVSGACSGVYVQFAVDL
jgi:hypothetical protein